MTQMKSGSEKSTAALLMTLTVSAALIGTMMSGSGMYNVARQALEMSAQTAWLVFGFLEAAQLAESVRARVNYRLTGKTGADGVGMWVLGFVNAFLASLEAYQDGNLVAMLVRFVAPLVSVFLWHRGIVLDQYVSSRDKYLRLIVDAAYGARKAKHWPLRNVRRTQLERALLNGAVSGALDTEGVVQVRSTLDIVYKAADWTTGAGSMLDKALSAPGIGATRKPVRTAQTPAGAVEGHTVAPEHKAAAPTKGRRAEPVETLVAVLDQAAPSRVPNRADALKILRARFGACSDRRADEARKALLAHRASTLPAMV